MGADRPSAHRWWFAVKLAVTAAGLGWISRSIDVRRSVTQLASVDPLGFVLAVILAGGTVLVAAWRWQLLLHAQGRSIRYWMLGDWLLVATFFNQLLPSSVGGDFLRITDSAESAGSTTVAATVVLFDRLLGLVALLGFGIAGLALVTSGRQVATVGAIVVVLLATLITTVVRADALAAYLKRRFATRPLVTRLGSVVAALQLFRAAPGRVAVAFGGALTTQFLVVLFYLTLARAAGIPLLFSQALAIVPATLAMQALPVSINGLGVREMTFAAGFKTVGLVPEDGVAISVLGVLAVLVLAVVGGLRFVVRRQALRQEAACR